MQIDDLQLVVLYVSIYGHTMQQYRYEKKYS